MLNSPVKSLPEFMLNLDTFWAWTVEMWQTHTVCLLFCPVASLSSVFHHVPAKELSCRGRITWLTFGIWPTMVLTKGVPCVFLFLFGFAAFSFSTMNKVITFRGKSGFPHHVQPAKPNITCRGADALVKALREFRGLSSLGALPRQNDALLTCLKHTFLIFWFLHVVDIAPKGRLFISLEMTFWFSCCGFPFLGMGPKADHDFPHVVFCFFFFWFFFFVLFLTVGFKGNDYHN